MTVIQSDGSACTVAPGHHDKKKPFCFRVIFWLWCCISRGWICICICWYVGPGQWQFALQVLTHLLGWPRGIQCTLCSLHIKTTMWKSSLQKSKAFRMLFAALQEKPQGILEIYPLICKCSTLEFRLLMSIYSRSHT